MSLTLYYHPLSSYCHKVLVALYEHGVAFEPRLINLGDATDRARLQALWPLVKFPVLSDGERGNNVAESSVIIEYLDHYYPAAHRLVPEDFDAALAVRLWDRVFDNHVHAPMQQIVLDRILGNGADMSQQRAALLAAYALIDTQVATTTWAAGDAFSMADCAAAPALFYASTLQPFGPQCTHLVGYFERLMARPSVQRVLQEARPYFTMYPFAESIPERFR
jgi:glutathione S-transferase